MNRIICCDAEYGLKAIESGSIPQTVTSPPWDNLRTYGGHAWTFEKFKAIAVELERVTMKGGVICWNVRDQIVDGSESGTSFGQALYFKSLGLRLHQTLVIVKVGPHTPRHDAYGMPPEYVFVFSKGQPATFHPLKDRANGSAGMRFKHSERHSDGSISRRLGRIVRPFGKRRSVWEYGIGWKKTTGDRAAFEHPALMPEALAKDLIVSWSNRSDVILDPFCGAGTTCKMAILNDRQYLGFEVHRPYVLIAEQRVENAWQHRLSLCNGCNSPRRTS